MAFSSPLAVVGSAFSGRRSRIALWDTSTDEVVLGQWVKGSLELLDLSPDGRYLGYFVQALNRPLPSWLAISRPPYLTALAFWPISHVAQRDVFFSPDGAEVTWVGSALLYGGQGEGEQRHEPRIADGCPLKFKTVGEDGFAGLRKRREAERSGVVLAVARHGPEALLACRQPAMGKFCYPASRNMLQRDSSVDWDNRGRMVVCSGFGLYVFSPENPDGIELLDMWGQTFEEVETPDWAREW